MLEDWSQLTTGDQLRHTLIEELGQDMAAWRIGKAEIERQLRQIRHPVLLRLGGPAHYVVDLGTGIDIEIRVAQLEHAEDTGPPLYFPVVVHIRQIFLVTVASHPDQPVLAQAVEGQHRFVLEAKCDDLITVIVVLGVEHRPLDLVTIGTDPGIGFATLHQGRDWPVLNDYRVLLAGLLGRMYGLDAARLARVFDARVAGASGPGGGLV